MVYAMFELNQGRMKQFFQTENENDTKKKQRMGGGFDMPSSVTVVSERSRSSGGLDRRIISMLFEVNVHFVLVIIFIELNFILFGIFGIIKVNRWTGTIIIYIPETSKGAVAWSPCLRMKLATQDGKYYDDGQMDPAISSDNDSALLWPEGLLGSMSGTLGDVWSVILATVRSAALHVTYEPDTAMSCLQWTIFPASSPLATRELPGNKSWMSAWKSSALSSDHRATEPLVKIRCTTHVKEDTVYGGGNSEDVGYQHVE
ncbi:hypothetical protein F5146DRAFT_1004094 [Armillaria mellea]|nr:hypothetical protein F5146DRAFT_1004094 [Armillaria mellea]